MRVAITGVSGFIGSFLARRLAGRGHLVTGLVRPTSRRDHIASCVDRFVVGDQADDRCWPDLLDGADCVIHNSVDWDPLREETLVLAEHLERNLAGSIRLLYEAAPRQFIFISSISVHHDIRPRWEGLIDEDHPLRPGSLYAAYKAAVEAHLWAAHFGRQVNTSAFRPCGVYGMDPKLDRSMGHSIVTRIRAGQAVRTKGGGKFVHIDDVVDAVVAAVGNPDVAGRAFNLADCYARWADWAKLACEIMGQEVPIDFSSPPEPRNRFSKQAVQSLCAPAPVLDRGFDGIRGHLAELIEQMASA